MHGRGSHNAIRHIRNFGPRYPPHGFHDLDIKRRFLNNTVRIRESNLQIVIGGDGKAVFLDQINDLSEADGG